LVRLCFDQMQKGVEKGWPDERERKHRIRKRKLKKASFREEKGKVSPGRGHKI